MAKVIKPNITNEVVGDKLIITLSGTVGEPYWYDDDPNDFINEKQFKSLIGDSEQDIIIKLNSPGGDVFEGIALYNYIKSLSNHITIEVTSLAASAASIIAMAGDEVVMCTGSQMMIHEASTFTFGNKSDIKKTLNALEAVDGSLVDIYADRTGQSADVINDWLAGEKWFKADEAVENGLADSVKEKTETTTKEFYVNNELVAREINVIDLEADAIVAKVLEKIENNKVIATNKTAFEKYIKKGVNK
ncbi:Clp protease ClpP [Ruoffia tabacinasalis]|uniref:ATP-dependent Clp protease proteolytic subunit n=1 Tax=Ruoffia tabacinasalis TaxID=87458 RepID=A0A5R9EG73_9LACT|nr:head maturation protease, ClpP-related [Ruoffia tabacinasalis]TLQ49376.1 Clp protease ClpP [Ruoffia tabacinasalis]